jgi:hypothetical protein
MIDVTVLTPAFLSVWGETIHYISNASGTTTVGGGRAIVAVVDRQPRQTIAEAASGIRPFMHVSVQNKQQTADLTASPKVWGGIARSEIDTGTDLLLIPLKTGGVAKAFHIARILTEDEGMMSLEVR